MKVLLFLFLLVPSLAYSNNQSTLKKTYYGEEINESSDLKDLKSELHIVLNSAHIEKNQGYDVLTNQCPRNNNSCSTPISHSYRRARELLFGQIYLEQTNGQYWVESFYCDDIIKNSELPSNGQLGPDSIPDESVLNTEHSWPQSRFTTQFPKNVQKTDLHALFPVLSKLNSTRGNRPYGYVIQPTASTCLSAKFGMDANGNSVFEPSDRVKGNVARALFYFSTRYLTKLDPDQEETLRQWHKLDPVDETEMSRHEEIYEIQKIRNPYIDHPEWVDKVSDF